MRNKANIILYYDASFTALRMLVGAMSAVYLLRHGVSIVTIGLMKSMQAAIYFAFDIPSSYLADRFSRKAAAIIATVLGGLWLLITGLANSVPLFFFAEALNALSLTIAGGAMQAYLIDNADDNENIHKIIGKFNRLSFLLMAISALAGTALAQLNDRLPWIAGGIGCLALAGIFGRFLPKPIIHSADKAAQADLCAAEQKAERHFLLILRDLFTDKSALIQAISVVSLAVLFQFMLQYWQLLIIFPNSAIKYGVLFCFILLAQSLAGHLTAKMRSSSRSFRSALCLAWLCLAALSLGVYSGSNAVKIAALVPLFGIMQILRSLCGAHFHAIAPSAIRSTAESVLSTSAKFLVMLLMPVIAYLASHGSWLWFCGFLGLLLALCTALATNKIAYPQSA